MAVYVPAGLEEYAAPIIEAIDPTGTLISDCLYRPACTRTAHHQCIKDLVNLGRPLSRYGSSWHACQVNAAELRACIILFLVTLVPAGRVTVSQRCS